MAKITKKKKTKNSKSSEKLHRCASCFKMKTASQLAASRRSKRPYAICKTCQPKIAAAYAKLRKKQGYDPKKGGHKNALRQLDSIIKASRRKFWGLPVRKRRTTRKKK